MEYVLYGGPLLAAGLLLAFLVASALASLIRPRADGDATPGTDAPTRPSLPQKLIEV